MGACYSGLGPDFRAVLLKARKDIQRYHAVYQDRITPFMVSKSIADLFQEFTNSSARPFGIGVIIAGFDEEQGPQIYQVEASGTFYCWKASALGKGATEAKQFFEKTFADDLDIGDATHLAIKALKSSFDGELTDRNLEVGIIKTSDPEKKFHILSQEELRDLLREVE